DAHARGEVAIEPAAGRLFAGGEVGAGASARVDAKVTAGIEYQDQQGRARTLASVTAGGYAQAGASVEAHAHVGYDDGVVSFDIGAGASLGLGVGYDIKGKVDVGHIAGAVADGIDHAT